MCDVLSRKGLTRVGMVLVFTARGSRVCPCLSKVMHKVRACVPCWDGNPVNQKTSEYRTTKGRTLHERRESLQFLHACLFLWCFPKCQNSFFAGAFSSEKVLTNFYTQNGQMTREKNCIDSSASFAHTECIYFNRNYQGFPKDPRRPDIGDLRTTFLQRR